MIVIPSDFSEKVLEVNAVNAEKTTVTYKVNAAGNSQVENEANKVAKDIVSDLNSQLVDMYMVCLLYTSSPEDITEEMIADSLYTESLPRVLRDPDLIIRTSGEIRLSNFLPWQAAYSELYFTDVMWPDFGEEALRSAIVEYSHRHRRFGGV